MAKASEDMSKSLAVRTPGGRARGLPCVHLYVESGRAAGARSVPAHSHRFWQMDAALEGRQVLRVAAERRELRPGECVILPPGVEHGFDYDAGCRYMSAKFEAARAGCGWRVADLNAAPCTRALFDALALLLFQPPGALRRAGAVVDATVSAIFAAVCEPEAAEEPSGPIASAVRGLLRREGGRRVTVGEVAEGLGYSTSRASALFSAETGMPLKRFLDEERGRHARQLVEFSDLGLKEIADRLGFPDPFGFSRFFKRVHGMGPAAARRKSAGDDGGL